MDKLCCTPKPFEVKGEGDCIIACCKSEVEVQKVTQKETQKEEDMYEGLVVCCCWMFKKNQKK